MSEYCIVNQSCISVAVVGKTQHSQQKLKTREYEIAWTSYQIHSVTLQHPQSIHLLVLFTVSYGYSLIPTQQTKLILRGFLEHSNIIPSEARF